MSINESAALPEVRVFLSLLEPLSRMSFQQQEGPDAMGMRTQLSQKLPLIKQIANVYVSFSSHMGPGDGHFCQ